MLLAALLAAASLVTTSCGKEKVPEYEGYRLLWHDEFNGSKLDESIWNKEVREPGWTNHEMQAYTKDKENIYVKNGKLVLNAVKHTLKSGNAYYTSGKVQTHNKKDFKYGKVIVRAKVPTGTGLWPAIWMMPTDEEYGNWPCSGEIDIMEVLGNETNKTYGTIHYGSPHGQKQGSYILTDTTFADDFHTFEVDWEPGEFRWYVDGNLFYTENNWFSTARGGQEFEYPAPFNRYFYLQLNLAVGGDWPGKPTKDTDFTKSKFEIDYVRVYQKKSYNLHVKKPDIKFPEPDENGNYIHNGDFAKKESLSDSIDWAFLVAAGGKGKADIDNGVLSITTEQQGNVDYSIQLVHPNIGMRKGKKYRIKFDAKADEERRGKVGISAPEVNWIRYFPDTPFTMTTDWATYTYEFEMDRADDPFGRLEFNLGHLNSKATVHLKNVTVTELN